MTTKEKVAKLKEDLKRRKAMLKGDVSVITDAETGEIIENNPNDDENFALILRVGDDYIRAQKLKSFGIKA